MYYFAHLLLALSPPTILARPGLAQTALATNPVVHALYQACDAYVKAADEAQTAFEKLCRGRDTANCLDMLVRIFPTESFSSRAPLLRATQ